MQLADLKRLCRVLARPLPLFALGLLLLWLAWLLRRWLPFLFPLALAALALLGLLALAFLAAAIIRRICRKGSGTKGVDQPLGDGPSTAKVPGHTYKRPDPLIYAQYDLMAKGIAVTWDNPDISVEKDGVRVDQHSLDPDTIYTVRARVWNGSTDAPAVNLSAHFGYLEFGIGTKLVSIGQTLLDLPVKGAPGCPAETTIEWRTPAVPGHYCLQVELVWPDDANLANNLGQSNADVKALNSPRARFRFRVRNDAAVARTLRLEADGYALITPEPCDPPGGEQLPRGREASAASRRAARHRRGAHPLRPGWTVAFSPGAELDLRAGEEIEVEAEVVAPDEPTARTPVNVQAYTPDGRLVGGVTLYVHR